MSNEVLDALRRVIPLQAELSGRGWLRFNCPTCTDTKGRGAILETPTGGFRYNCFNSGCQHDDGKTGWEPGNAFAGRPRRLFLELGGDLSDIPPQYFTRPKIKLTIPEFIEYMMSDASAVMRRVPSTVTDFPEIELPERTQSLWDARGEAAERVQAYVLNRGDFFQGNRLFCWSPKYPLYVIIPLQHRNKYIGWIGRRIVPDKGIQHLKCAGWPSDYMLNQDRIHEYPIVLVVESVFDAIALDALCTFGARITQKQINLLNQSAKGKKIVLIPDQQKEEWRGYWKAAKDNEWSLSVPEWGGEYVGNKTIVDHIKDPGEAIQRMGLLCTMQKIMSSITTEYASAEFDLLQRSRGLNDGKELVRKGTERTKRDNRS